MDSYEETRLAVLQEFSDAVYAIRKELDVVLQGITECVKDPERWPPHLSNYGTSVSKALESAEKVRKRYSNIIDLHRMPQDRGDAAIKRALSKLNWRFYAGHDYNETFIRGYHQMIDINVSKETGRPTVIYHGDFYGTPVWTLVDPTVGEVLEKLELELPVE